MRLRRPLPAVQGDTLHIVGVGDNRIGKEQTIAVSTIKPDWLEIDDATFRRANNALERAALRIGQSRGHALLARTALHHVIGKLEKSGLGRDVDALRKKLLDESLADILIVAEYYAADGGLFMSLQAVGIADAKVFSSTREYSLPLSAGAVAGNDREPDERAAPSVGDSFRDCPECPCKAPVLCTSSW